MKFFEAQKRASFATKLFATIGFDFDAALAANNENALKAHTGSLDTVAALFTAAGLDQKALLAAGPDSLKLHIEGLDDSAELTALEGKLATATSELTAANLTVGSLTTQLGAHSEIFTAIGFDPKAKDKDGKAQDPKTAFESHVSKQTTLALAKTGHPPAHVPKTEEPTTAAQSDAELFAEYSKMEAGPTRLDFYTKHEAALLRANKAAQK